MYARDDTINWLLAKRSNPNLLGGPMSQSCLHLASARRSGQAGQVVKLLLSHSKPELRCLSDSCGAIPLFCAVEAANTNVCRELLAAESAAQLAATKQPLGDSALHLAARKRDHALVKVLIEAGGGGDRQNEEGQTLLHLAAILGDEPTVRVLFMARANPGLTDKENRVPIHLAAERGFSSIVQFLADKFKASIYDRTRDGSTLMHIAAVNGHPDTAMILFERGVRPLLASGQTAPDSAGSPTDAQPARGARDPHGGSGGPRQRDQHAGEEGGECGHADRGQSHSASHSGK